MTHPVPFVDEFINEPPILRSALAAAVGPLPDVEVTMPSPEALGRPNRPGDAWLRAGDTRHRSAIDSGYAHLERAREHLALFVHINAEAHASRTTSTPTDPDDVDGDTIPASARPRSPLGEPAINIGDLDRVESILEALAPGDYQYRGRVGRAILAEAIVLGVQGAHLTLEDLWRHAAARLEDAAR